MSGGLQTMNDAALPAFRTVRSRRKTVSLEVTATGEVVVRAPMRLPQKDIAAFVAKHRAWILEKQKMQSERQEYKNALSAEDIARFTALAKEILPPKVAYYSQIMGVTPTGLRITNAQKRFGSCNTRNALCFSWILMQYPEAAVDYVVVHELAHIRYHNHSPEFYRFIAQFLPDYRAREAILRQLPPLPDPAEK